MTDAFAIQTHIEYGRGKAAQYTGVKYDVYRLSNSSTGDVLALGNKIATGVMGRRKQQKQFKGGFETPARPEMIMYTLIADLTNYLVGDIFIENDPSSGQGFTAATYATTEFNGLAIGEHEVLNQVVAPRVNIEAQIFRQTKGSAGIGGDISSGRSEARPLKLVDGQFLLGALGDTAAKIPVGLTPLQNTYGDREYDDVQGINRKSAWRCYIPPIIAGYHVKEGDRIVTTDGAQYTVLVAYQQDVGVSGSQHFLERENGPT